MSDADILAAHLDARDLLRRSMSIASSVPSLRDVHITVSRRGIVVDRADVYAACVRLSLPLCDVP